MQNSRVKTRLFFCKEKARVNSFAYTLYTNLPFTNVA